MTAHHASLGHLDVAERNVVEKNGEYRLIDLRDAVEHLPACQWTYKFGEHIGCKPPRGDDPAIGCAAIEMQASKMQFWDSGKQDRAQADTVRYAI